MSLGNRSARRRGMIIGAAVSSSRNARRQAAAAQPVPAPTPTDTTIEQLTQLGALRDKGILTDEEFAVKKKQILGI